MKLRFLPFSFLLTALFFCVPGTAFAQSISLQGPLSNQTVAEGDDYFSDMLDQPADGFNRYMIGWEENFVGTSVTATNGLWQGTFSAQGGYVFPVFPNISAPEKLSSAEALPGDRTLPKYGINHQIDGTKYTRLAYRLNQTNRSSFAVYWESRKDLNTGLWPVPSSPNGASFDGWYHSDSNNNYTGFKIYDFDLANSSNSFEVTQGAWNANNIHALRIDPSLFGSAGSVTQFDWIRLVDPNSAPNIVIDWNSSGINSSYVVSVYHDTDASGFNGTLLARYGKGIDPGSHTIPSAILPPGDHYFYVELQRHVGGSFTGSPLRTAYSARVRVTSKPSVYITSPSPTSGDDYATVEVGNPWDMDPSGVDIENLGDLQVLRQFINESFVADSSTVEGGYRFQAQAEPPYSSLGNLESDVQFRLNTSSIDPNHYRYAVIRFGHDATLFPTVADRIRDGWVARFVAWNTDVVGDGMETWAFPTYPGMNTYWLDMADVNNLGRGPAWESYYRLANFRFDPGEFTLAGQYVWTFLDYAKLVGENRAPGDRFTIRYSVADADSSTFTVRLYYDTDNTGFNGTLIATLNNQTAGNKSFTWNTSSLPANTDYYIYVEVDDGTNTTRRYSSVHVKTGAYVPGAPDPRLAIRDWDWDGDGVSEPSVWGVWGIFYDLRSLEGFQQFVWADYNYRPIRGDFDGDGKIDRGVTCITCFPALHIVIYSSTGGVYARYWGAASHNMVINDYNGDGLDELAVYDDSLGIGIWAINPEDPVAYYWGLAGDIPVPADYDGDGKTDPAVWRPSDGTWYVLNSSYPNGASEPFTTRQWGLNGMVPVPGDWDSDGKADWMAWDANGSGVWYLLTKDTENLTAIPWGLAALGDLPIVGDFNGDGLLDITVFRSGNWYINNRNGATQYYAFGGPIGQFYLPKKTGKFF